MRPAMLSNNDFTNVYSGYNYSSPKISTSYQRPVGYSFKNETPKSTTYSSRLKTDNLKTAYKTEKITDSPLERRSTPTRDYSASRIPPYSTTSKGFYNDNDKSQDDRSFYDSYKTSLNQGGYSPYRNSSATPLSRSTYLKDDDSPILTRRKLDMDFDLEMDNPSSFLRPSDSRPSTAKNKDRFEDFGARRTPTGYSHVEDFVSKYKTPTGNQGSKLSIERTDPSPRGYSLSRPGTSSSTNLMTSTLRNSLYADSSNAASTPNIKKTNNFFDAQNNSNNETSRLQKFYSNMPSFEYKKYDEKDASELMSSLNKPLLTRSEMNLLKNFERTASSPDNKGSLYNSRFFTKSIEPEEIQQPRQSGEKSRLDSYVTKVDRGATFLTPQKSDDYYDSRNKDSSYYEEASTTKTSPFKLSHSLLDKESRFFKDNERNKESSYKTKETTTATTAWNGRSTRASSIRHDDSTDSSPDEKKNAGGYAYYMTDMKKHLKRYDSSDYFSQIYREHFQQTFQALKLCKFMKNTDFRTLASKKVYLTKKDVHRTKKTLIFDLDETLIHCVDSPHKRSDIQLNIKFPDGERMEAGINIRPYAIECLRELSQYYEVMVFTASHKCYATAILDYLDPHKQYIQHRLFRDSCVYTDEGVYVKDLRILANRDLNDVILVDNAAYSYGFQLENGVPIIPFYENKSDQELKHLTTYLKMLSKEKNLREVNKRTFKLHLYTQYNSQEDVKNRVFA